MFFAYMYKLLAIVMLLTAGLSGGDTMFQEEAPAYLYKILSQRNWKATQNRNVVALSGDDDAFIHFSKEDQLERILQKYWAEEDEVVILKIATALLQGRLVYETNPGGSAKYYHLYDGFIPYEAIQEAKILLRHSNAGNHTPGLDIVQNGHPVLRAQARELTPEEILSPETQELIESMKTAMRNAPGVGLAAPQIGHSIQLAVIEDMDQSRLTPEQIQERKRYPVPFHVIINPKLYFESAPTIEYFEGCLSVPSCIGLVPRAESVRVECLNERAEPVTLHATGWYARILQHEIDHLHGTLYIDRAYLPTLMTEDNFIQFWKHKTIQEVKEGLVSNREK